MKRIAVLSLAILLFAGCANTPKVTPARTIVPVACQEKEPDRPSMPVDGLPDTATLPQLLRAARAEIKLREGYEDELLTALQACITPLTKK